MPDITLDDAQRIVARGRAAAEAAGMKAVFAVLDKGANLVAFSRMDGAWLASNELAIAKARTSVMFQAPTEALNAPLEVGKPVLHFDHIHSGGLLLVGGWRAVVRRRWRVDWRSGGVGWDARAGCRHRPRGCCEVERPSRRSA